MNDKPTKTFDRRNIIKWSTGAAGGLLAYSKLGEAASRMCPVTPKQPEGPFYPETHSNDEDADLTVVQGRRGRPLGELIVVTGFVKDEDCQPVEGALIEIWQASANGRYKHRGDAANPKPLDPNFQYWGQTVSDADGRYWFKTIKPGHYYAADTWIRPPHIHFRLSKRGYVELITQMYFAGNPYNGGDRLLQRLRSEDQRQVVIDFVKESESDEFATGHFDVTLARVPSL